MIILQTRLVQTSSHIVLTHLVRDQSTGSLAVMRVPSTLHSSLAHTMANQVAVMGSLAEGGFLQLIGTQYRAVVAESKVKTTSHKGKGMFLIGEKLYLCISSRIMSTQLGIHLKGGLDMMLGRLAEP